MTKEEKAQIKQQKKIERLNKPHPLKYKKAGIILTRAEVAKIKADKKVLRAKMKEAGLKGKKDRQILEASSGAYFDQRKSTKALAVLVKGRVLLAIFLILLAVLSVMFALSEISKMRGHFSVNLTDDLFKEGFSIGESVKDGQIVNPTSYLAGEVVEDTPCTSIAWIDKNVHEVDGSHNGQNYFAHTFYIQNAGDSEASYAYEVLINSQSMNVANAAWVMLFVDGEMEFYAKATSDGDNQTLPSRDDNTIGFQNPPFMSIAKSKSEQFELIANENSTKEYYRLVAKPFQTDEIVTSGKREGMQVGEIHKYTVVLWLEGDDPDCTDDLIGGHIGLEFNFKLLQD